MNYILFDEPTTWKNLLPLTYTRPVSELRVGILTIKEKWEKHLKASFSYQTTGYLVEKFGYNAGDKNLYVNSALLPDKDLVEAVGNLPLGMCIVKNGRTLAYCVEGHKNEFLICKQIEYAHGISTIDYPWDIFVENGKQIEADIPLLFNGRQRRTLDSTNNVAGKENIYIEEGAKVRFATINAETGPVYLGKDSEIMEGAVVRGPFALCSHAVLKLSAKVYGPVTIGPYSKVGGEVSESVIQGYSNKSHDGFLGNAVLGEWCNLGADTNNSNLKNNYEEVKLWNYQAERFIPSGLQFCGLVMGDHSKCGINTMFNTGTVVGVSANIFGSGFPRNFIPSFSWGGAQGYMTYKLEKALDVAEKVLARRKMALETKDINILKAIFEQTMKYRRF
jgi:UDP-N-acetylglucosamine diphosphorylase/glucosamine-1-phosphate N-acetyltransferase